MVEVSPISVAFGKAIRQERIKRGITQDELADRCSLDRSYISRIERGKKNPTLSVVWTIATEGLGVSFLALIILTVHFLPESVQRQNS